MTEKRRGKRVGSLIHEELSRFLIEDVQGQVPGLITVTRVEMTDDLLTAHIFLSVFGGSGRETLLALLEKRKGYIRRILASRINLKYNPELFFSLDQAPEEEEKLDRLFELAKKHES
jgi:ribosome-binding factor A